jgi:hypothetical protein
MRSLSDIKATLLIISLSALPLPGISIQAQAQKIDVKIFQVPAFQSIIKTEPSTPAEEGVVGGIRGTKTGGYVTGFFPDGIVLFETYLKTSREDIKKAIKERVMPSLPDWVQILPVADAQVILSGERPEGAVVNSKIHPQRNKHLHVDYGFKATPLVLGDEETVLKLVFSVNDASGEKKVLLDQPVALKADKTLVVGFPTNEESGGGTLFFISLTRCAET